LKFAVSSNNLNEVSSK